MGLAAFGRPAHRIGWSVDSGTGELRPPAFLQDKSVPPDDPLTVGRLWVITFPCTPIPTVPGQELK